MGTKLLENLSCDLRNENPDASCFSVTNLDYCRRFFKLYAASSIPPQVEGEIPVVEIAPQVEGQLKSGGAKPEGEVAHLGQLGLYVSAANHLLRRPTDAPTIGLLICKSKDNVVAKWALESASEPLGISEYQLTHLLPRGLKSDLPTIEEIESVISK